MSEFKKQAGSSTPTSVCEIDWVEKHDTMNVNELLAVLSRVGAEPISEDEIRLMLRERDRDGDGCITLEELSFIGEPDGGGEDLRDAFNSFDDDHDGKITVEELYNVFTTIGNARCTLEECRRMITEVDSNGDGFVCFQDFTRMMHLPRRL